ncbi:MAG TPA: DNA-processing protein DprA [Rhodothermales bacterium]|nr:DNA-processing protein DprA [Rhodothermales bacterium]
MTTDHILPADTQAILLLCGHFDSRTDAAAKPLTLTEYNSLAAQLRRAGQRPEDLLQQAGRDQIDTLGTGSVSPERLTSLLERGVQMSFAVEAWAREGIWVISRGEPSYPLLLKRRLRESAPALLFGVGNRALFDCTGLGIAGSRTANDEVLGFVRDMAMRCAAEGIVVVSGGARGVDEEAMQAALAAGGSVIGVLPEGVSRPAVAKAYRDSIQQQRLLLVSAYHPKARWTTGNAMGRNRHIYALSTWVLVANSGTDGGTWTGAVENLKHRWTPLFVRDGGDVPPGNKKLIQSGALALADPFGPEGETLRQRLDALAESAHAGDGAPTLFP